MTLSIKNKTLIIFSALFLAALLAQTFYFTPSTRKRLIDHSIKDQARIADLAARQIESSLNSARHELEFIAQEIERGTADRNRMDRIIASAEETSLYYKTFYVLDKDARWVAFPRKPEFVGRTIPRDNIDWVRQTFTQDNTLALDVNTSKVGTMVSGFARPLHFDSGEEGYLLRGVIALSEDNSLLALANEIEVGETGYAYLVSRDGSLLASPKVDGIGRAAPVDYSNYPPVAALMKGEEGNMEYFADGISWSASYRRIEPFNWGLVVKQPLREITRPADQEARRILAFSGIALLAGSIIFLFVIRLSLKPLGSLLSKIKSGQDIDANGFADDETGQLARKFNELFSELSRSKRDKEILLAEMHHRVKNNMQTISSLLMLQEDATDDAHVRKAFSESVSRIRAMALVHEALYKSDDLSSVDIAEYVNQLLKVYEGGPAAIVNDVSHVNVNIRTAIPVGIIINELVANAMEHAFTRVGSGVLRIECDQKENGRCSISVSDNGSGLPDDADLRNDKSLGLFLVNLFVSQLGGELQIERNGGTRFTITFKPVQ